jgi:hypothetical protein
MLLDPCPFNFAAAIEFFVHVVTIEIDAAASRPGLAT